MSPKEISVYSNRNGGPGRYGCVEKSKDAVKVLMGKWLIKIWEFSVK